MVVKAIVLLALLLAVPSGVDQHPETLSLLGDPLFARKLPKSERVKAEAELARAHQEYKKQPSAPDAILALAAAHTTLGRVGDAVVILTHGIEVNPNEPRLNLARGRGYVSLRKFEPAQRDFNKAADRIPEARCGVALTAYLTGDYERARSFYAGCNEPGVFAYLAERRTGRTAARPAPEGPLPTAAAAIRLPGTVAAVQADNAQPLAASYLAAIEKLLSGDEDAAREQLKKIVEKNPGDWMDPAYIAAEADYARVRKPGRRKR